MRPAGGAGGHHVAVVAEDGQRPCAASERAAMWNTVRVSSPAILYMLGIISSKPWTGGKRRGQGAGLQRAVHGAGGAAFGLHFLTSGTVPHMFGLSLGAPLVGTIRPSCDEGVIG